MVRPVAPVRNDVSEESIASIIRITRVGELLTTHVPSSPSLVNLKMEELRYSETSGLTTATRRNIPEDGILYSHRRENLKCYIALTSRALEHEK
jgi:hypothetical protein